jgi:SAM-dependent methyltransferase
MKINLGCGDKKLKGFINVDVCGNPDINVDLSMFPWPFEDESADEIYSEHFLEHVKDFEKTIFEIHRVLKPNGILHFKVPHFKSPYFPWHVHLQSFSGMTCMLLCNQLPYVFKGQHLFSEGRVKFNYPYLSPVKAWLFSKLSNWNWSNWEILGLPIQEIEFWAKKV